MVCRVASVSVFLLVYVGSTVTAEMPGLAAALEADDACRDLGAISADKDGICALGLLQINTQMAKAEKPAPRTTSLDTDHSDGSLRGVRLRDWNSRFSIEWKPHPWPSALKKPTYIVDRPIKIGIWTSGTVITGRELLKTVPNCTVDFLDDKHWESDGGVIKDRDFDTSQFDVLIFSLSALGWNYPEEYILPRKKLPGQLWYATCNEPSLRLESNCDCRLANDTATMAVMDGFSSWSLTSDFPAAQDPLTEEEMRRPTPDFASRGDELATMALSDCAGEDRNEWVQGVMREFERRGLPKSVLSYGGCLHNAEEPDGRDGFENPAASRPFKLVAENTIEPFYVTEKVWVALEEGSVPVYWGSEEVKRWVPEDSIIFAPDYSSVEALVDRMINFSEEDFARARAFKSKPISEWHGWLEAWQVSHKTLLPRFCEAAAAKKREQENAPEETQEVPEAHDLWCGPACEGSPGSADT